MTYYIHQGSRNDRDENYPGNPFDRDETVSELILCDDCGDPVFDQEQARQCWNGCDRCLVENAKACGDWDEEALAAQQRLNHK